MTEPKGMKSDGDLTNRRHTSMMVNFPTPSIERVRFFRNYNRDDRNKFKNCSTQRSREHDRAKFPDFICVQSEQYREYDIFVCVSPMIIHFDISYRNPKLRRCFTCFALTLRRWTAEKTYRQNAHSSPLRLTYRPVHGRAFHVNIDIFPYATPGVLRRKSMDHRHILTGQS